MLAFQVSRNFRKSTVTKKALLFLVIQSQPISLLTIAGITTEVALSRMEDVSETEATLWIWELPKSPLHWAVNFLILFTAELHWTGKVWNFSLPFGEAVKLMLLSDELLSSDVSGMYSSSLPSDNSSSLEPSDCSAVFPLALKDNDHSVQLIL